MKKLILTMLLGVSFAGNAQITKNNWMLGGNANFSYSEAKSQNTTGTSFSTQLAPNVGYFVYDKLAVGSKFDYIIGNTISTSFYLGPFVRYYFLDKEKRINLFLEPSYNFGLGKLSSDYSKFSTKAGTAIFMNSSVALELSLNYNIGKSKSTDITYKSILFGVGLQIHLEREK